MREYLDAHAPSRNPPYGAYVLATRFFAVTPEPQMTDALQRTVLATFRKMMPPKIGGFAEL